MHDSRSLTQNDVKLIPSLLHNVNNVIHYLKLKFYIEHGLNLVKIHRIIHVQQSCLLQAYIAKKTNLRAAAMADMEKDFVNLTKNTCYGKTCENQAKYSDMGLVTDTKSAKSSRANPNVRRSAPSAST